MIDECRWWLSPRSRLPAGRRGEEDPPKEKGGGTKKAKSEEEHQKILLSLTEALHSINTSSHRARTSVESLTSNPY